MNRIVIERQDLYALLEERFAEHRKTTGCQVCKTPFPFFCDAADGVNWRVATLAACERSCRKTLVAIVNEMAQKYQLSQPLWRRTYDGRTAAPAKATAAATGD